MIDDFGVKEMKRSAANFDLKFHNFRYFYVLTNLFIQNSVYKFSKILEKILKQLQYHK